MSSINIVDCTTQYKLPDIHFLRTHSNNVIFRMCTPINEVYEFILYLLKFGVDVYIKVIDKDNLVHPYSVLDTTDLYEVFEILKASSEKEER